MMAKSGVVLGGRYRLAYRLGAGGMSTVWAAEHLVLGSDVAVRHAVLHEPRTGRRPADGGSPHRSLGVRGDRLRVSDRDATFRARESRVDGTRHLHPPTTGSFRDRARPRRLRRVVRPGRGPRPSAPVSDRTGDGERIGSSLRPAAKPGFESRRRSAEPRVARRSATPTPSRRARRTPTTRRHRRRRGSRRTCAPASEKRPRPGSRRGRPRAKSERPR